MERIKTATHNETGIRHIIINGKTLKFSEWAKNKKPNLFPRTATTKCGTTGYFFDEKSLSPIFLAIKREELKMCAFCMKQLASERAAKYD